MLAVLHGACLPTAGVVIIVLPFRASIGLLSAKINSPNPYTHMCKEMFIMLRLIILRIVTFTPNSPQARSKNMYRPRNKHSCSRVVRWIDSSVRSSKVYPFTDFPNKTRLRRPGPRPTGSGLRLAADPRRPPARSSDVGPRGTRSFS